MKARFILDDEIQVDEYNKESEALKKTLDPRLGQSDCAIDLQEEQNDDQTKHSKSITDSKAHNLHFHL